MTTNPKYLVAVIGAGPAGIYGTRILAEGGAHCVILNRDVKPGGLAEYGIYPDKHKMKEGLRKQFRSILTRPDVDYYGNARVGTQDADFTLDELRAMGFQAMMVTVGAQGTKWLGLPGEELRGVYHAKDVVYHYNYLPPFSEKEFHLGRRVAVVGIGNVMVDIARWLVRTKKVEEVVVVVRRGPGERKYDKGEIPEIIANFDVPALKAEFQRIGSRMRDAGQDPDAVLAEVLAPMDRAEPGVSDSRIRFEFLSNPAGMLGDDRGDMRALVVEDTMLVAVPGGEPKAKGTGTRREIAVDSVIFAIGDRVDESLGLPFAGGEYVTSKTPRFPVEGVSHEVEGIPDIFVAGWARKASDGLVGVARKDGTAGSEALLKYLATQPGANPDTIAKARRAVRERLEKRGVPLVDARAWEAIEAAERSGAQERGLVWYKFGTNREMLDLVSKQPVR